MTEEQKKQAEQMIDELAAKSNPSRLDKLDRQFTAKLARLEKSDKAPADMLERLRLFWRMVQAPDDQVPMKSKALLMAGLGYFASPFDLIPDIAGKLGYLDDAMVLRMVETRLGDLVATFREGEKSSG